MAPNMECLAGAYDAREAGMLPCLCARRDRPSSWRSVCSVTISSVLFGWWALQYTQKALSSRFYLVHLRRRFHEECLMSLIFSSLQSI